MIIILNVFRGNFRGMALFPFIILKNKECLKDKELINHETIHLYQQSELLILPFYIIYIIEYIFKGYRSISFEKEAHQNDKNMEYLNKRKIFAWIKYLT